MPVYNGTTIDLLGMDIGELAGLPTDLTLMLRRLRLARETFHKSRVAFWAVQIPPAVWVATYKPEWERGLFAYLVVISLMALVESAATDWDQARAARKKAEAAEDPPIPG